MQVLKFYILSLFLSVGFTYGQISFYKVYSNSGYDYGYGIDQLEDSSYIVTGASSSFTAGSQAYLLKLDKFGEYEWSIHYGGPESEEGRRVLYKENVGFYVCGTTNSYGNGAFDFYLFKTDINGGLQWETTFGDAGWEKVNDAALTRDTGVLLVGETSSNATDNEDVFIVKTDKDGNKEWDLILGDVGDDAATCIKQYNDSCFVVGGYYFNTDSLLTKGVLYKIIDDGTVLDTVYLGENGNYGVKDIEIITGVIDAVGYHEGGNSIGMDEYGWEIDLNTLSVQSTFTTIADGEGSSDAVTSYDDNSKRYIAYTFGGPSSYEGGPDLAIGMFTQNLIWLGTAALIADNGIDVIGELMRTSDGGAIGVGSTAGPGMGISTVFVIKIGPGEVYPSTTGTIVQNLVETVELDAYNWVQLYPVPASNVLHVSIGNLSQLDYAIVDLSGKVLMEGNLSSSINSINITELEEGVYFIRLYREGRLAANGKFQVVH